MTPTRSAALTPELELKCQHDVAATEERSLSLGVRGYGLSIIRYPAPGAEPVPGPREASIRVRRPLPMGEVAELRPPVHQLKKA